MFLKARLCRETANATALLFTFAMLVFVKGKLQTRAACPRVMGTSRSGDEGRNAGSWKHTSSSEVCWCFLTLLEFIALCDPLDFRVSSLLSPRWEELVICSAPCWNSVVPGACPRPHHDILQDEEEAVRLLGDEGKAKLSQVGQDWTKTQVDVVYKKPWRFRVFFIASDLSLCCIRIFSLLYGSELAPSNLLYSHIYFKICKSY